ncbi:MAG: vancomycin B-type resistance protein [Bacteroidetes bacterium]|nr:vancomycin B-type resistance protein [Bacteroidota bacterium]
MSDWRNPDLHFAFQKSENPASFKYKTDLEQRIMPGDWTANKVHNLKLAALTISGLIVKPGETFSFWNRVGNPTTKRGYREGRNLVNGKLKREAGGGLCQLSGALYFLALRTGMTVTERHAHSIDIYTEADRYSPLGSDATVVYGYKDFRFVNDGNYDISVSIEVTDDWLKLSFLSNHEFDERNVRFIYSEEKSGVSVQTLLNEDVIDSSFYQR